MPVSSGCWWMKPTVGVVPGEQCAGESLGYGIQITPHLRRLRRIPKVDTGRKDRTSIRRRVGKPSLERFGGRAGDVLPHSVWLRLFVYKVPS